MMTLTITDETFTGKVLHKISLNFAKELVTIEQIIIQRVTKEVEDYNAKLPEYFNGLIVPTDAEKSLNGYKIKDRKAIDAEKQVYIALDAFQNNGFFVLVDNHQAAALKDEVLLTSQTQVSFVKLTPLVGG